MRSSPAAFAVDTTASTRFLPQGRIGLGGNLALVHKRAVRAAGVIQEGAAVGASELQHRVKPRGGRVLKGKVAAGGAAKGVEGLLGDGALVDDLAALHDFQEVVQPACHSHSHVKPLSWLQH